MFWVLAVLLAIVAIVFGIWLLQRFYAKATLDRALVRTGLGGRRVVLDGGCLALPFLHTLRRVSMAAQSVSVARRGRDSVLCRDRLRADLALEVEVRVEPTAAGVAAAAQALGERISRPSDALQAAVEGFLIDALHAAAARRTLDEILHDRAGFSAEAAESARPRAAELGLRLISASLVFADQSDLAQLDENNAANAEGMRRLAEMVAEQRKARVAVETETEIAIRESRLAQRRRQLEIEQSEKEAELDQRERLTRLEAESQARAEQARAEASLISETSRLDAERETKAHQVANDEVLRRSEMKALLALEEAKIETSIRLAERRAEESAAKAAEEEARAQVVLAAEHVQSQKDRAVAERENEVALLRQRRELELDNARLRNETDSLVARAKAQAAASAAAADAERTRLEAEAQGLSARYAAENSLSDGVIRMRLEERRLDRLPEIMTQMMKPVEKIDSIRINHIGGPGAPGGSGGGGAAGGGSEGAFGAAMDQILGMAVRLPAMRKMGEEIGLEFDANLAGRTGDYANRIASRKDDGRKDGGRKEDGRKQDGEKADAAAGEASKEGDAGRGPETGPEAGSDRSDREKS